MGEDEFDASPSTGLYAMRTNGVVIDGEDPDRSNYCRFINHSVRRANCQARSAEIRRDLSIEIRRDSPRGWPTLPGVEIRCS